MVLLSFTALKTVNYNILLISSDEYLTRIGLMQLLLLFHYMHRCNPCKNAITGLSRGLLRRRSMSSTKMYNRTNGLLAGIEINGKETKFMD